MNNENFPHAFWDCFGPESKIFITMALSIVWKKLTVTVVKLISSLSWSYCQKEHSYFNTLLMHYYDFFGWLFFRNVGCFVLEKYRFLKYWILNIENFQHHFQKNFGRLSNMWLPLALGHSGVFIEYILSLHFRIFF